MGLRFAHLQAVFRQVCKQSGESSAKTLLKFKEELGTLNWMGKLTLQGQANFATPSTSPCSRRSNCTLKIFMVFIN